MSVVDEQLKFIVGFAGADLDTYRPGDWENLRDDLVGFLEDGQATTSGESYEINEDAPPLQEADLRSLQGELRFVFEWCLQAGSRGKAGPGPDVDFYPEGEPGPSAVGVGVSVSLRMSLADGDALIGVVGGSLHHLVHFKTYQLLRRKPVGPLQRCPECHRLFLPGPQAAVLPTVVFYEGVGSNDEGAQPEAGRRQEVSEEAAAREGEGEAPLAR